VRVGRKAFALSVIILVFAIPVLTPNVQAQIILGHITGTVTDETTGLPIGNATVMAKVGFAVNSTATTNETGYYDISGLNGNFAGITYNVTAAKTGYYPSTVSVTMYSSVDFVISVTQDLTLTPLPTPTASVPELPFGAAILLGLLGSLLVLLFFRKVKK